MTVHSEQHGQVLELVVDEPSRHHPFSGPVIKGLKEGLEHARVSADVRCVLVRSTGDKVFLSGADLDAFGKNGAEFERTNLYSLFEFMEQVEIPVVCAVQGLALGGGFEFAICSDLVVASERAQFGLPETSLGLAPGIAMVRLPEQIGRHLTMELSLTKRRLSAQEALELNIVNAVTPHYALLDAARLMASEISNRAPLAVAVTKRAVNRNLSDWLHVRSAMALLFRSADFQEGLAAFREKRAPQFRGN